MHNTRAMQRVDAFDACTLLLHALPIRLIGPHSLFVSVPGSHQGEWFSATVRNINACRVDTVGGLPRSREQRSRFWWIPFLPNRDFSAFVLL